MRRLSQFIWVYPKYNYQGLYEKEARRLMWWVREGGDMTMETDQIHETRIQGMPAASTSWKKKGMGSPFGASRKSQPC